MIPVGFGLSIVIAKNLFHSCLLKLLLQSTACRHLNQKLARACQCGKPSSLDAFQASTRPTHVTYAFLACILVRESAVYTTSAVSFGEASLFVFGRYCLDCFAGCRCVGLFIVSWTILFRASLSRHTCRMMLPWLLWFCLTSLLSQYTIGHALQVCGCLHELFTIQSRQ